MRTFASEADTVQRMMSSIFDMVDLLSIAGRRVRNKMVGQYHAKTRYSIEGHERVLKRIRKV